MNLQILNFELNFGRPFTSQVINVTNDKEPAQTFIEFN